MKTILFATKNKGKLAEIREILAGLPVKVLSMEEAGIHTEVVEDGTSFAENAEKKAVEICRISGMLTLADDSGLVVDALGGEPGIYSARYMGEDTPYPIKNQAILDRLQAVPEEKRTARFVSAVAAAFPDGRVLLAEGVIEGSIAHSIQGEGGFGYDPIFYVEEYGMTTGEMPSSLKNSISHRAKALQAMRQLLDAEWSQSP